MCQNHYRVYELIESLFPHGMKKINRNLLWRMLVTDSLSRPANVNRRIREIENTNEIKKKHCIEQLNGKIACIILNGRNSQQKKHLRTCT